MKDIELQNKTIADLALRCDGPGQFENFDRTFRHSLTIPKAAVVKEENRLKRVRAKSRTKKPSA